jgi:hypothetical protein
MAKVKGMRWWDLGRMAVLLALLGGGSVASAAPGALAVLRRQTPPARRTQVLVLATFHYRELKDGFRPALVEHLMDRLAAFRPDTIAVEALPGDAVRELGREMNATPVHREVAEGFAATALDLGQEAQRVLGVDALEATRQLGPGGRPEAGTRGVLVALAAYEWPTALLAWSQLSPEDRDGMPHVPKNLAARLETQLGKVNEIQDLALPLARRLGLARLDGVDAFEDLWAIGPVMESLAPAIRSDPRFAAARQAPVYRRSRAELAAALRQGDLLPAYRFLNSARYASEDAAAQWGVFLRTGFPGEVGRGREALWEERNLKIAARIRALSARHPGGRILVLYGAAHKPFLEAFLSSCSDLMVVRSEAVLGRGRP